VAGCATLPSRGLLLNFGVPDSSVFEGSVFWASIPVWDSAA
jgi:hypothetical protein